MTEYKTNFAFLMDLLNVDTAEMCERTGADKTLVSRWRNGKRRLMPGRHWVISIADCFLDAEARLDGPVLTELLQTYYPSQPMDTREDRHAVLCKWLTAGGGKQAEYQIGRKKLLDYLLEKARMAQEEAAPDRTTDTPVLAPSENMVMYGLEGVRNSVLMSLELVLTKKEPQDFLFVCPQGPDLYTRDERFGTILMDKAMEVFRAGHRLSVVLRTDYKLSDVSAFSGRWLVAHLMGFVKSYYYDDFRNVDSDKMLFVLENQFAMKVTDGKEGLSSTICFDPPTINGIFNECTAYRKKSTQRFQYNVFEKPNGFLRDVSGYLNQPSYLMMRTPQLGIAPPELMAEHPTITQTELNGLLCEFPMLFRHPKEYSDTAVVRHIFCENDIEDALLKSRSAMPEVSTMLGREVYLNTKIMVRHIALIQKLLAERKAYEVCFLPEEHFSKIPLQLGVWGSKAAIGWVSGNSTAFQDYTNVGALHGFCDMIWDRIPGLMKSRTAARRKLATWLKKAAKYGYSVDVS